MMKKKLLFVTTLVFMLLCIFTISAGATQCDTVCTDNWVLTSGDDGYLGTISATNRCPVCNTVIGEETIEPLFATLGYSYNEANAGITQHFAINRNAVARYEQLTGKEVLFGGVVALRSVIGDVDPITASGEPISSAVQSVDFKNTTHSIFDVMLNGIPQEHLVGTEIICSAYVIVDGEISYIENGVMEQDSVSNTYYDIVKAVSSWDDTDGNEGKSFKVLTIGNSFSDDSMEYVYHIAKQVLGDDVTVELGNLRYNSCSLSMHLNNAQNDKGVYMFRHWQDGASTWKDYGNWNSGGPYSIQAAVTLTDWDYIIFQQVSDQSTNASTYDDLNALIKIIEPLNPKAKLGWHMTWSPKADTTLTDYNKIVSAVNSKILTNRKIDIVIPSGTAIQNAKTSYITDNMLQRDAKHLSYGMGRYIAGLTYVKTLTGCNIDNVAYPTCDTEGHSKTSGNDNAKASFGFTDEINKICIESANNAVSCPFSVTSSQYTAQESLSVATMAINSMSLNNYACCGITDYSKTRRAK